MGKLPARARRGKFDHVAGSACPGIQYRMRQDSAHMAALGDNLPTSKAWPVAMGIVALVMLAALTLS